jgi:hypothetical protein
MGQKCGDFGGKRTDGQPCGKPAGWGVPDRTDGKCRRCCRLGAGRPIVHGRYSKFKSKLAERAQTFADMENPWDFNHEAAMLRQLLDDFLIKHEETGLDVESVRTAAGLISDISRLSERNERIRASKAFTAVEYQATINMVVNIIEMLPESQQGDAIAMIENHSFAKPALPPAPMDDGDDE